jgi:hypothetical protein
MEPIIIAEEVFYEKRDKLKLVKQLNWENYYLDKKTGERWIEEYPHSEMQGGGPPQLRLIEKFPWEL